jgi:energy-coupling factor transporter ATP-binding protein EcfA2
MFIKSVEYSQFEDSPQMWVLEQCMLGNINLLAGKNASGKSRTLNILLGLSKHLSIEKSVQRFFGSGNFKVKFEKDGKEIVYILKYSAEKVIEEKLYIEGDLLLTRGRGGIGT